MREIEFRGKTENLGEWVYGHLLGDSTIIPQGQVFEIDEGYIDDQLKAYSVFPKTIGQYIGLKDKNGNKIFEGDILTNEERVLFSRSYYFAVKFKNGKIYGDGGRIKIKKKNFKYLQIVGNIYENSDFLEDN